MTPNTILFATDLSCRSDRALDRAAMMAAEWNAKLIVVHALREPNDASSVPSWRRPPDPHRTALETIGTDLLGKTGFELEVLVKQGDPSSVILDLVGETGCDLIITGVARNELLGRSLLGTTVEKLTRLAIVPVLIVKSRPRVPYRNVVVGTDFSEGSRLALNTALAWLPESQLSLFHAYDVAFEGLVGNRSMAREVEESRAIAEAVEFLETSPAVAKLGKSIKVFCEYGSPEELLQDMVQAKKIDLIVLGNEGRSRLANVLLGSVAHRILERVPVDVLVARKRR